MENKHNNTIVLGIVGVVAVFAIIGMVFLLNSNSQKALTGNALAPINSIDEPINDPGLYDVKASCCETKCYADYMCDDGSFKVARCRTLSTSSCSSSGTSECDPSNPCSGSGWKIGSGGVACSNGNMPCTTKDPLTKSFN